MASAPVAAPEVAREHWRFTVEDYERMAEIGILHEDAHVELIDGEILTMSPIGIPHNTVVARLTRLFVLALGDRAIVRPQMTLQIPPLSEPEPDLTLLAPRDDDYGSAHPRPADVLLLIEVADSSLRFDRGIKLPLYARADIVESWVVDLVHNVVIVAREPAPDGYRAVTEHRPGETIAPLRFPDLAVDLAALLR